MRNAWVWIPVLIAVGSLLYLLHRMAKALEELTEEAEDLLDQ